MNWQWHGTFSKIEEFKPFFHCGTWKAAVKRIIGKASEKGFEFYSQNPMTYMNAISISGKAKIYPFEDAGDNFKPIDLATWLGNTPQWENKWAAYVKGAYVIKPEMIYSFCIQNKIDGFKYVNHVEDSGSLSYIIINTKIMKVPQKPVEFPLSTFIDVKSHFPKLKSWGIKI